jgi:hypothetical protein
LKGLFLGKRVPAREIHAFVRTLALLPDGNFWASVDYRKEIAATRQLICEATAPPLAKEQDFI